MLPAKIGRVWSSSAASIFSEKPQLSKELVLRLDGPMPLCSQSLTFGVSNMLCWVSVQNAYCNYRWACIILEIVKGAGSD